MTAIEKYARAAGILSVVGDMMVGLLDEIESECDEHESIMRNRVRTQLPVYAHMAHQAKSIGDTSMELGLYELTEDNGLCIDFFDTVRDFIEDDLVSGYQTLSEAAETYKSAIKLEMERTCNCGKDCKGSNDKTDRG